MQARISDRAIVGVLLVALGIMFLLDNTNALGPRTEIFGTYWPAFLIAWGLWGFVSSGFAFRFWKVVVLMVGVIFLMSNLNLWSWDAGQLWPLALVGGGLALIFRRGVRRNRLRRIRRNRVGRSGGAESAGDSIPSATDGGPTTNFRVSHIFGGGKEQVTTQDFQGGEVSAVFGGVELDLRGAGLSGGKAVIDANVFCGGVELWVPKTWQVNLQASTLFAGVENKHTQPKPEDAEGELTITGTGVCGGLEIKD